MITADARTLSAFWSARRAEAPELPEAVPEAWGFGATPEHADGLLDLVLRGIKTGTASSMWDYEATGDALPEVGELSVILDGRGGPRAVIETTDLRVVPFDQVGEEHARAEGEGNRTLAHWRAVHERYWREHSENPRGYEPDMPVLCERFRLLWPENFGLGKCEGPHPAVVVSEARPSFGVFSRPLLMADKWLDFPRL